MDVSNLKKTRSSALPSDKKDIQGKTSLPQETTNFRIDMLLTLWNARHRITSDYTKLDMNNIIIPIIYTYSQRYGAIN